MDLTKLRYTKSHEWADLNGDICTVGITQFAVEQLTDVTYLELPVAGKRLKADDEFGVVESVKSTSPLLAPVGGEVVDVNAAVLQDNSLINSDPYGAGWMIKIEVPAGTTLDHLLTADQYQQQIASEGH